MTSSSYAVLIDLACGIAAGIVLLPVIVYLLTDWKTRRDDLLHYLKPDALEVYYEQFLSQVAPDQQTIQQEFKKHFDKLYGRQRYLLPLLLLGVVTILAAWGIARGLQVLQGIAPARYGMPVIAVSATAGAFAWVVTDQLGRFRRRDFTPTDISNAVFRFLLAVPFGYAFSRVVKDDFGIALAFFLGAFPTGTLFTIARRIATQRLGLGDQDSGGSLELEKLQSVGRANAERFQDEGINSIAGLAWPDPVGLTIRTNFDFNYVLDCMNQALLWVYFEDKVRGLFVFSLRGAQEVCALLGWLEDPDKQSDAEKSLEGAATTLGIDKQALLTTLRQVQTDPYTQFILKVWH